MVSNLRERVEIGSSVHTQAELDLHVRGPGGTTLNTTRYSLSGNLAYI